VKNTTMKVRDSSLGDMLRKIVKHVSRGLNALRVKITEGPLTGMKMLMQLKPMQKG